MKSGPALSTEFQITQSVAYPSSQHGYLVTTLQLSWSDKMLDPLPHFQWQYGPHYQHLAGNYSIIQLVTQLKTSRLTLISIFRYLYAKCHPAQPSPWNLFEMP